VEAVDLRNHVRDINSPNDLLIFPDEEISPPYPRPDPAR